MDIYEKFRRRALIDDLKDRISTLEEEDAKRKRMLRVWAGGLQPDTTNDYGTGPMKFVSVDGAIRGRRPIGPLDAIR